jgi:hypothetical protein
MKARFALLLGVVGLIAAALGAPTWIGGGPLWP